jgi:hypothetical protein
VRHEVDCKLRLGVGEVIAVASVHGSTLGRHSLASFRARSTRCTIDHVEHDRDQGTAVTKPDLPKQDAREVLHQDATSRLGHFQLLEPLGHGGMGTVYSAYDLQLDRKVAILGDAIGRKLKYVDVPDSAAKDSMLGAGLQASYVDAILELTNLVRAGKTGQVTNTVQEISGSPARTFSAWARENAAVFS